MIAFQVPALLREQMDNAAKERGLSRSELLRQSVQAFIKEPAPKKARRVVRRRHVVKGTGR